MKIKLFEIRDEGTFIPAIAIEMCGVENRAEHYLLRRAGYAVEPVNEGGCILFGRLEGGEFKFDPYDWSGRTMPVAHKHLTEFWESLESGQVIDVQYILGETPQPKLSEALT